MTVGWHGAGWYTLVYVDGETTHAKPFYFSERVEYEAALALGDRAILIGPPRPSWAPWPHTYDGEKPDGR
jgi:hypothetical protein